MTDPIETLRTALADRYTIERELGRGGSAVVYLAHDRRNERQVAIKVLRPDVAHPTRRARFVAEKTVAARFTHPNILALHDSGEVDGILYYVMPYVTGESLRDRLTRDRQLPLSDALQIAREVADALSYAHAQGVIHRDIKPENILLQAGHAIVADFGIARAAAASGAAEGTPAYVSPEQAAGSDAVDPRSDVYALGCVLYEMLAGHPPFSGATAQEIMARHALDPVPKLRAARALVPEAVERAVTRALAKQPVDRFPTAAAFGQALTARSAPLWKRPRIMIPALAGIVLLLWVRSVFGRSPKSIAVLPFANLSTDTGNDALSSGISEELSIRLGQVPGLRVIGFRTAIVASENGTVDPASVGRRLDVGTFVTGSVRRAGDSIRVGAQLVSTRNGQQLWAEQYGRAVRDAGDIFRIQSEIVERIVRALKLERGTTESRAAESTAAEPPPTADLTAYDLYLKGRQYWNRRDQAAMLESINYFAAAVRRDSNYAPAFSGLADAQTLAAGFNYLPRAVGVSNARAAAERAMHLDSNLAEVRTSLARAIWDSRGDPAATEREYRAAIRLNPNYPLAHSWYGRFLAQIGRYKEAEREGRLAVTLDPLEASMHNNLGEALGPAGRNAEAAESYRRAIALAPTWRHPRHQLIANVYEANQRWAEAIAGYRELLDLAPDDVTLLPRLARVYIAAGQRDEAIKIRDRLELLSRSQDVWQPLALVYTSLGDRDRAFEALERARANGYPFATICTSASWEPLRSDPRWDQFLKSLGRCQNERD